MPKTQLTQITDLHFGETPEFTLAGIRPLDSFKAVLDAVNDAGRGDDLLLLSGDLSGTSSAESYIMLNQLLQDYGKQALWLPGNHDNVELMKNTWLIIRHTRSGKWVTGVFLPWTVPNRKHLLVISGMRNYGWWKIGWTS